MLSLLKVNDKVDVLYPWTNNWYIGTIKSNHNNLTEIDIDGFIDKKIRIQNGEIEYYEYSRYNSWISGTVDDNITALNTHTPFHYYLNNPSINICTELNKFEVCSKCLKKCCIVCNLCQIKNISYCNQCIDQQLFETYKNILCCSICEVWLNQKQKKQCQRCNNLYCNKCGLKNGKLCKNCEIFCKQRKYRKPISNVIGHIIGNDIINIITSYCNGHIIYCLNVECNKLISINNQTEFENNMDSEGNKIYKYNIRYSYASAYYSDSMHLLYGTLWRIFCSKCTETKLMQCRWNPEADYYWNGNMMLNNFCVNYDIKKCCKDHAYCGDDKSLWKYVRDSRYHSVPKCYYDKQVFLECGGLFCKLCKNGGARDWYSCEEYCTQCYYESYDISMEYEYQYHNKYKEYYRHKRYLFLYRRSKVKNSKYDKKGMLKTKTQRKKKSYFKRKKDKKSNCESNKKFKKRYQLSLQY